VRNRGITYSRSSWDVKSVFTVQYRRPCFRWTLLFQSFVESSFHSPARQTHAITIPTQYIHIQSTMNDVRGNCLGTNMHTCTSFTCREPPTRYGGCRFNYPSAPQYEGYRFNYPSAGIGRNIRVANLDLMIVDECSTMTQAHMHIIYMRLQQPIREIRNDLAQQRRHQDSIVGNPKIAKATNIHKKQWLIPTQIQENGRSFFPTSRYFSVFCYSGSR
jgi:hypothetical protein